MTRLVGLVVIVLFLVGFITAHGGNVVASGQAASFVGSGWSTVQGWWAAWHTATRLPRG